MVKEAYQRRANQYPRITLHCLQCGNEFNISVTRFRQQQSVDCQICDQAFPQEFGDAFYKALNALFEVKYKMDEIKSHDQGFEISFVYKSTFKQPPGPLAFVPEDFDEPEPLQGSGH